MGIVGGYAVDLLSASWRQFAKRKGFSLPLIFFLDILKKFEGLLHPYDHVGNRMKFNSMS